MTTQVSNKLYYQDLITEFAEMDLDDMYADFILNTPIQEMTTKRNFSAEFKSKLKLILVEKVKAIFKAYVAEHPESKSS